MLGGLKCDATFAGGFDAIGDVLKLRYKWPENCAFADFFRWNIALNREGRRCSFLCQELVFQRL